MKSNELNAYLTPKSRFGNVLCILCIVFCFFFAVTFLTVGISSLLEGDILTGVVGAVIGLQWACPIVLCARHIHFKRRAQHIAVCLVGLTCDRLPISQLSSMLSLRDPEKKIRYLITKKYLKNLLINYASRELLLTADTPELGSLRSVSCPNCGAKNNIVPGRPAACAYCNQVLWTGENAPQER